ncbi:glycosyltransferase [Acrocarpospora catenulata]|uniref:glycosyltransferase n=1 Tax=Acrocarpospora catenulata TaxID=2836182 RepID=UPI001BD97DA6|nr:glycosyltransferase [Acrocarpospora catenulata]
MTARIRHNDYGTLAPPALGAWRPRLTVTVVVPAYQEQAALDRTLAALTAQTYPAELLDVVVVDDGSDPPLTVPTLAPARTRLVRVPEGRWGRGWARRTGAAAATGEVIHWLDSDMILYRDHLEAHLRWHHLADHLAVHGMIKFTSAEESPPTPEQVAEAVRAGNADTLFPADSVHPHDYVARTLDSTRWLKDAGERAYLLHSGATTSVRRAMLAEAGGVDASLNMGEDTELGYRLAQAGAVFVPDGEALSWHIGLSTVLRREDDVHRHNWSVLAGLIPELRWLRQHPRRQWPVPYVRVLVDSAGASYEQTRATVDSALAGTIPDTAVTILGPWSKLPSGRRRPLDEPLLEHRLIANLYAGEPRVTLAESAPPTAAPTPFQVRVPAGWVFGASSLARLTKMANAEHLGLICAALDETPEGVIALRLERTAAFARAARHPGEPADEVVHELFGSLWVDGAECGLTTPEKADPLTGVPAELRAEVARWRTAAKRHEAEAARWRAEAERLAAQPAEAPRRNWLRVKARS